MVGAVVAGGFSVVIYPEFFLGSLAVFLPTAMFQRQQPA